MSQTRKKYLAPAVASALVAGLGQTIKGEAKKGLKIMLWFYLGLPMILYGTFLMNAYIFLMTFSLCVIIYPLFWALNIMDAYSSNIYVKRRA